MNSHQRRDLERPETLGRVRDLAAGERRVELVDEDRRARVRDGSARRSRCGRSGRGSARPRGRRRACGPSPPARAGGRPSTTARRRRRSSPRRPVSTRYELTRPLPRRRMPGPISTVPSWRQASATARRRPRAPHRRTAATPRAPTARSRGRSAPPAPRSATGSIHRNVPAPPKWPNVAGLLARPIQCGALPSCSSRPRPQSHGSKRPTPGTTPTSPGNATVVAAASGLGATERRAQAARRRARRGRRAARGGPATAARRGVVSSIPSGARTQLAERRPRTAGPSAPPTSAPSASNPGFE